MEQLDWSSYCYFSSWVVKAETIDPHSSGGTSTRLHVDYGLRCAGRGIGRNELGEPACRRPHGCLHSARRLHHGDTMPPQARYLSQTAPYLAISYIMLFVYYLHPRNCFHNCHYSR